MGYLSLPQPTGLVSFSDNGTTDAFGRLRTSTPYTLFDSKQLVDKQPLLWDDQAVSGGGTSTTYSSDKASTTIGVSLNTAGKRVRQTFQRFNYQPGKSQLILMTGTFSNLAPASLTGIKTGIGMFDDNNGLFFSYESGVMYAVVRSKASGVVVDNKIAQSSWNIDRFDGTGLSGVTLDPTKTQICFLDYEWLGVGSVRFGFVIDRNIYYVHQFNHANILAVVYMSTPNLPLRYSIENTGAGAACTMQHICATVASEGGRENIGNIIEFDNGITPVTCTTAGTAYALLGMRLNSSYLGNTINILKVGTYMVSQGAYAWNLIFNPTVAGTFTYGALASTGIDVVRGTSANTVTGGLNIAGDYGVSTGSGASSGGTASASIITALKLGASIAGVQDTLVLSVTCFSNNEAVRGSLTFQELS